MPQRRLWVVALAGVVLLATGSRRQEPTERHVILVSVDGLAARELEDETLEIPNIRELIRDGVWAESSESVFPVVTHPSHTTIVTGVPPRVHGVVGNRVRDRNTGERFHITNRPHRRTVRAPTIFDAAKARRLTTASFFWPESWQDPSIDFNIPEVFDDHDKADVRAADPELLEELRRAGVPIDLYYRWYGEPDLNAAADVVLAEAAGYVIRTYRPHLLAIHLVALDDVQHEHGVGHYLSKAALTTADRAVGLLRGAVEDAGLSDRTVFFVVADHGFQTVRYAVNLEPLFARAGLAGKVALHPSEWTLFVELTDAFDAGRDQARLDGVLEEAAELPGVDRVVRPEAFHALGYPSYHESPLVPGQYMILGDIDTHLVAASAPATAARYRLSEPEHGHGYLPSHPRMYPAFVVSGSGIRHGKRIGHVRNVDIAPTIGHLLSLELPGVEGRVLTEALSARE